MAATKKTTETKTAKKTDDAKTAKVSRSDQILKLLSKNKEMTTAEVREALNVKAAFGMLARMRDAGLIEEYEVEGQRGSSWAIADNA